MPMHSFKCCLESNCSSVKFSISLLPLVQLGWQTRCIRVTPGAKMWGEKNILVLFHVLPLSTISILFINNFSDLKNISINILVFNRWSREKQSIYFPMVLVVHHMNHQQSRSSQICRINECLTPTLCPHRMRLGWRMCV